MVGQMAGFSVVRSRTVIFAQQASTERGLRKKIGLTPRDFVTYKLQMIELRQTKIFTEWLDGLSDQHATARIAQRLVRLQSGLFGDVKPVGQGLSELRIDYGPGYRVYFLQQGRVVIILLCGGDKGSQRRDIERAQRLAAELED